MRCRAAPLSRVMGYFGCRRIDLDGRSVQRFADGTLCVVVQATGHEGA